MRERLDQRFIGVLHAGIFADDRDRYLPFRAAHALVDQAPEWKGRVKAPASIPKAASTSLSSPSA